GPNDEFYLMGRVPREKKGLAAAVRDHEVDEHPRRRLDVEVLGVDDEVGRFGRLVGAVDAREALDPAGARLAVEALGIAALAFLERRADPHLEVRSRSCGRAR